MEGTLKTSFDQRGFIFIEPESSAGVGRDVFLHVTALREGEDSTRFVRGARVEFDVVMVSRGGEEKPQARDARLVEAVAEEQRVAEEAGAAGAVAQGHATTPVVTKTDVSGHVKFWYPTGYGFVSEDGAEHDYFVSWRSAPSGYLRDGDVVLFDVAAQGDDKFEAVNVRVVGWEPRDEPFCDQLDMGSPRSWTSTLAQMAETEPWNYPEKPARDPFVILRSYVKYTFLRLNESPEHVRVSADESWLSFNTGLVTPFQEEIFALFRRRADAEAGPPWVLRSFEKASSVQFLQLFGGNVPPLASYYDDPSLLVYDTRMQLSVNVEHVPHDPERFPESLKNLSPADLAGLVNAKAPQAVDRVRRNYKTAIPQFYRDGRTGQGNMQLLLPVALLRSDEVELALAVDRPAPGVYLGRTVLTLDWAYNNARLLTRPDTDWLRP